MSADLPDLRDFIRTRRAALAGFMEQGAALELDGDVLTVIPRNAIYVRYLSDNSNVIADLATEFFARPIRVVVDAKRQADTSADDPADGCDVGGDAAGRADGRIGEIAPPAGSPEPFEASAIKSSPRSDAGPVHSSRDAQPANTQPDRVRRVFGRFHQNGNAKQPSKLAHAIAYARHQIRVFPVHEIERGGCSCGKLQCPSAGKHPRLKDWQILATTDEDQIHAWWREWSGANIGVACGQGSNLTVLDVDGDEGRDTLAKLEQEHGELPETPIAVTGSGGAHYYFAFEPGLSNAVKFAEGLDVRTEGGLVVGVGSITKQPYRWEAAFTLGSEGLLPSRMPQWLAQLIKGAWSGHNGQRPLVPANAHEFVEGSGRNDVVYKLGRSLKAQGFSPGAIAAALTATNQEFRQPFPARELDEQIAHIIKQPDRPGFVVPTHLESREPEKAEAEPLRVLSLGQLYNLCDEWDRQPWVWDGILPRASLSLIVGKSETGKSTMIYGLIYAIVRGLEFLGRQCERGPVLYLAGDAASEIVAGKTFRSMGLTPGVDPIHVVPGALVTQPSGMQMLRAWVRDLKPIMVVGDTLAATVAIDTDKYGQSYQVQQPLSQLARQSSANFLMAHHSQKAAIDSYSVIDSALGSVGVAAVASTRMVTRMYRRGGKRYYTFEMSSLRIGTPLEGEWTLDKAEDGQINLGQLWGKRAQELDRELIFNVLVRVDQGIGISERTLWNEIFPKPKWQAFKPALEAMVENGQVIKRNRSKRGGGKEYLLASREQTPPATPLIASSTQQKEAQGRFGYKESLSPPRKVWGDEGNELDENGIPKWK